MRRQQVILVSSGFLLLLVLFFFGKTVPSKKDAKNPVSTAQNPEKFDIHSFLSSAKTKLTASQQAFVNSLESSVVRGDIKNQRVHTYHQLADFWKDSIRNPIPYAFYTAEASKLENSEKSLTFAAQLFLDNLRGESDPSQKTWMATQARELFERSLKLNPSNDSAKIGLGSTYIFAGSADDPTQVMTGIQQILEVARRDSSNMYAQLMLGLGGVVSGQLDKGIERLLKVTDHQPANLEAILTLAEAYEKKGDKGNAVKWYERSKTFIMNPEVIEEIDSRIKLLK